MDASLFLISVAASLAPPPPSILQVTPQLPLMGFVARVQENSKFAASLCNVLLLNMAFELMKDLSVYSQNSAFSTASASLSEIVKGGKKK